MSQSLDQLVNLGLKLLDDSNDPNEAHSEHEGWVQTVSQWLQIVHNSPAYSTLPPDSFKELAIASPKTAMIETWKKLVSAISDAAKRSRPPDERAEPMTPSEIVNHLFQAAKIGDEIREEFFRLKKWHDSAVVWHTHQEPKDALGFAELTNELVRTFEAIR